MTFLLLVLAGSLVLLPAATILTFFLVALADFLLGGGPVATTTDYNLEPIDVGALELGLTSLTLHS